MKNTLMMSTLALGILSLTTGCGPLLTGTHVWSGGSTNAATFSVEKFEVSPSIESKVSHNSLSLGGYGNDVEPSKTIHIRQEGKYIAQSGKYEGVFFQKDLLIDSWEVGTHTIDMPIQGSLIGSNGITTPTHWDLKMTISISQYSIENKNVSQSPCPDKRVKLIQLQGTYSLELKNEAGETMIQTGLISMHDKEPYCKTESFDPS